MSALGDFDQFFEPLSSPKRFSKKQLRRMSKKQMRKALLSQEQRGSRQQEQGLGLIGLVKSKEFKQRMELLKEGGKLTVRGSKIAYAQGRIAATKLASRIRKARSKSIYD